MKTIQITLDDDVHRLAKSTASSRGITLGEFIRQAVAALLEDAMETRPTRAAKGGAR